MEHNKVVRKDDEKFINVPAHLTGIEHGDLLVISEFPDTHKYTKEQLWLKDLRFCADAAIQDCMANGYPLYVVIHDEIPDAHKKILRENGYDGDFSDYQPVEFYMDQVTFFDKVPGEKKKDEPELTTYSIASGRKDRKIIDEMIALIDRDRFIKMCSIAIGHGGKPSDKVVDKYLEEWAKAKYNWYVAFGRSLTISAPIEFKMDEQELTPMVFDLYSRYPMYVATMERIRHDAGGSMKPFVENKMPHSEMFSKYSSGIFKPGMKVSRFLSALYRMDVYSVYDKSNMEKPVKTFKDLDDAKDYAEKHENYCIEAVPNKLAEQFDIDFSKVMQDRIIKGNVVISIDPYDFLTSGTNMHGWSTCQKLWGSMAGALFSWLTDPGALIAYRDNGREYLYDTIRARGVGGAEEVKFGKNAFKGNSKSWRQLIHCDPSTCTFLFSREYPKDKNVTDLPNLTRKLLEDTIGKAIGVNDWDNYGDIDDIHQSRLFGPKPIYKDLTHHHYSDVSNWASLKREYKIKKALVSPTGTDMSKVQIAAGGETYCLICGKKLREDSSSVVCGEH